MTKQKKRNKKRNWRERGYAYGTEDLAIVGFDMDILRIVLKDNVLSHNGET